MKVDLNDNDISWVNEGKRITVIGDYIDAAYDKKLGNVTALNANAIYLFDKEGNLFSINHFSFKQPGARIYSLANESASTEKSVRIIIAHEPPFKGERFWQHEISLENGVVSEPIKKWR